MKSTESMMIDEEIDFYMTLPVSKPDHISPRVAMEVVYQHRTDDVEWLDNALRSALRTIRDQLDTYAQVEFDGATGGRSTAVCAIVRVTFFNRVQFNRLKLVNPDLLKELQQSFMDYKYGPLQLCSARIPRYSDLKDFFNE